MGFPFLVQRHRESNEPVWAATRLHLSLQQVLGSEATNPYRNIEEAFHITFYERLADLHYNQSADIPGLIEHSQQKGLKVGYLYQKTDSGNTYLDDKIERAFRLSAFTVSYH